MEYRTDGVWHYADADIRAEYHGGAYVEISLRGGPDHAVDVINVYDYTAGRADPTRTTDAALKRAIRVWKREVYADYAREYRRG